MHSDLISKIHKFTLNSRQILEQEASSQLEGIYGWLPDGSFSEAEKYPALEKIDEARETRRRLESYAEMEQEAGNNAQVSREMIVREAAFTWLNRLVALKMMEERRLIKETISRLWNSNAFKLWIADEVDSEASKLYHQGEFPYDELGEGPRHQAYRRFILWECSRLSRDTSILFDPNNLASRLLPRPLVLEKIVEDLNSLELSEAWKPGNEETIGWIYQAFNAEELQKAFAGVREHGKKFEPRDIPSVTQLFTIHWVVEFLVQNSLGRLWLEMHPDSQLINKLQYFVPFAEYYRSPCKAVREITFLDPACGSMHFGLMAFDLFVAMYKEELQNAGKPGWPEKPSVADSADIPASIIKNNIFGIDIDLRAVQISALTLYLKAKTLNPKCKFSDNNLACANIEHVTAGRLREFIQEAKFEHPIFERILMALADKLKDSDNLGSLLRLEEDLKFLIKEERKKAKINPQLALSFPEIPEEKFNTQQGLEEFFGLLEQKILGHLDEFVKKSREYGRDSADFASEAAKGLRFLRLVQHRYDVVTTNPPYLSNRKMNERLSQLLSKEYPAGKTDLYAAFIQRCLELTEVDGLIGMLTMHSFMFICTYEELRNMLRSETTIQTLAHFGGGLFAVGNPGTLQTAAYILRREKDKEKRQNSIGIYFRLVHEKDAEAKREAFESALKALREGQTHPKVFRYKQKDFEAIPGQPWVYWMPESLRVLFKKLPKIKDIAEPRQGLATADNFRFLRTWWEVGISRIGFNMANREEAKKSGKKWFPYMKGGTPIAWYGNQQYVLNWHNDGNELYNFRPIAVIRNPEFYFRRGVTWSLISSKGFAARLSPGGFIFDVAGMTCFPPEEYIEMILALLNSRPAKFILSALNPTINYQVGDIERLPVPTERNERIVELVSRCIELAKEESRESEITYDFIKPLSNIEDAKKRKAELGSLETEIDKGVSKLYGLSESDLELIERELSGTSADINLEEENEDSRIEDDAEKFAELLSPSEWALSWISYAAGIALGRFELGRPGGLGCGNFTAEVIEKLSKLISQDGILVNDPGQPLDLASCCLKLLEIMLEEEEAALRLKMAFGEGDPLALLQAWFDRFSGSPSASFWKYHFQLYKKRPVYWPLQSPGKLFTVWVFHEKLTKDTLFHIRNNIVEPRLKLTERMIKDLKHRAEKDRRADREMDRLRDLREDLAELSKRIRMIIERGYTPHLDDGVLLNAAPLYEILPSWPETKKAWEELGEGKYDWAEQAMEYWPERVKEKCKSNRSLAIAHGLEEICEVDDEKDENRRSKRKRTV